MLTQLLFLNFFGRLFKWKNRD